jgi:hypothetical protein
MKVKVRRCYRPQLHSVVCTAVQGDCWSFCDELLRTLRHVEVIPRHATVSRLRCVYWLLQSTYSARSRNHHTICIFDVSSGQNAYTVQ